jgi:hypothetical protein
MSKPTHNTSARLIGAAILAICTTGCMVSPQNGQYIYQTGEPVMFAGATTAPWQDVRIEAKHPAWPPDLWVEIEAVHTETEDEAYTDPNGKWYLWPSIPRNGFARIPRECWMPCPGNRYCTEVRARVAGDQDGLLTFKNGYRYDPFASLWDLWSQWGHGQSVTIYAFHDSWSYPWKDEEYEDPLAEDTFVVSLFDEFGNAADCGVLDFRTEGIEPKLDHIWQNSCVCATADRDMPDYFYQYGCTWDAWPEDDHKDAPGENPYDEFGGVYLRPWGGLIGHVVDKSGRRFSFFGKRACVPY